MPIRPENRDRYPKDWPKISRRIRLVRAQSQCECVGECGRNTHRGRCPNRQGLRAYGTGSRVILTEHHAQTRQRTRTAALEAQMEPMFEISVVS